VSIVANGTIGDRPFGRTIAAISLRGFTGELRMDTGGAIGFADGHVVSAAGTHPADSAIKSALGIGLITSSQAAEILRSPAPTGDDVALVAERAKLGEDQAARLRRRVVANRAMRLFAADQGAFTVDDQLPDAPPIVPIDARVIVYHGARSHFVEDRAMRELGRLGLEFRLKPYAADLDSFGFGEAEQAVLDALGRQAWQPIALAGAVPTVEARTTLAVLYALAMFGAVDIGARRVGRTSVGPLVTVSAPSPPPEDSAAAIRTLVRERLAVVDTKGDHFALLGVPITATIDQIRRAYFDLARMLHPDRIIALRLDDIRNDAQRLFAQINAGFAVISNPARHDNYIATLHAGGDEAVDRAAEEAEAKARKLFAAEEHFRAGEMALRRNQITVAVEEFRQAVELNPDECEHHALLAWTIWCAAHDKTAAARAARVALEKACSLSPNSPTPQLYLGKIARTLGDNDRALVHFREALQLSPGHGEASSELRIVEARLKSRK
jgi:Flp pilus assembly protein TadD